MLKKAKIIFFYHSKFNLDLETVTVLSQLPKPIRGWLLNGHQLVNKKMPPDIYIKLTEYLVHLNTEQAKQAHLAVNKHFQTISTQSTHSLFNLFGLLANPNDARLKQLIGFVEQMNTAKPATALKKN